MNTRLVTVRAAGRFGSNRPDWPRRSARPQGRRGAGEASLPVLDAGAVIVTRGLGRACRCGLRASRKRGRRAARASARSGCARRGSGGRVGVLAGCGGCRSRRAALGPGREVTGLASWLPFAGAPEAKGRRKPGRGGESHEHASSDTGGGLLLIPRAERESGTCDRGREHSAMEGVLAQRMAAAFDEAAAARGTAIRSDGDAVLSRKGEAGSAEDREKGRQRQRRKPGPRSRTPWPEGRARRSRRSGLYQDRATPLTWALGAQLPGELLAPLRGLA